MLHSITKITVIIILLSLKCLFKHRDQVCDYPLSVASFIATYIKSDKMVIRQSQSVIILRGEWGQVANYMQSVCDNMAINCDKSTEIENLLLFTYK